VLVVNLQHCLPASVEPEGGGRYCRVGMNTTVSLKGETLPHSILVLDSEEFLVTPSLIIQCHTKVHTDFVDSQTIQVEQRTISSS
jgi:hypothetical protein